MRKIRSDSIWNSLPVDQRKMLDHWLFVEHISYKEANARARTQWGVVASDVSVGRYYRRVKNERVVTELEAAAESALAVDEADGQAEKMRASAMKVLAMRLLEKVISCGDVKELAAVGRVLLGIEEREIQRSRVELAREKFEFRASKAALEQLPHVNKMQVEEEDREKARMKGIGLSIFGRKPKRFLKLCQEDPPQQEDEHFNTPKYTTERLNT